MTDEVNEWIEKAIPAGSGRYYALLHSDPGIQQKQRLQTTLISIFSKLGFQSREVEVVKHKLDWWRQELEQDVFRHPVTSAIAIVSPAERDLLMQVLNGYGTLLESGSPSTDEQNQKFHIDTGAAACQLLCSAHSDQTINESTAIRKTTTSAGIALSKFRCLRYLRQHVNSGLLCLPMSSLDAAGISPALLTPSARTDAVDSYLSQELLHVQQQIQDSLVALETQNSEVSDIERKHFKALYIYLSLQFKLLQSMQNDHSSVVVEVSRLTPIRNYWHAFRAARKFDKY